MKSGLILLSLLSIINTYQISANLNASQGEQISVSISKDNPTVDTLLSCTVTGIDENEVSYRWTINDEVVSYEKTYKTSPDDYESFINLEIYSGEDVLLASDSMYFSLLPVIYLDTDDGQIMTTREIYKGGYMYIQGNYQYKSQYDGKIEVKGRGNTSWGCPKNSFKLKLSKKTDLFGFGKSKHYVLLNSYLDPTLLRNKIAFDISKQFGLTTTDSEFVQVIFNKEYYGTFLLCEHIRIGSSLIDIEDYEDLGDDLAEAICKADKSISIDELEEYLSTNMSYLTEEYIDFKNNKYKVSDYIDVPENINGGFLYELTDNNRNTNSAFVTNKGVNVNVSKPEYIESNSQVFEVAKTIINDFEEAIYSSDGYNSKGKHFTELCNIDSLASYFLTLEILGNEDAASRSRYCYIDADGVLEFGPVWDFDISSNAYQTIMPSNAWTTTTTIVSLITKQDMFKELLDDPIFQMKVYEKYRFIKPYLHYIIEAGGLFDDYVEYTYLSCMKNEYRWIDSASEIKRSYTGTYGDLNAFKEYLNKRIKWLDEELSSEESTYESLSSIFSSNRYVKSDKVQLNINDGYEVDITVPTGYEAQVYLNGIIFTNELSFIVEDNDLCQGINTVEVVASKNNKKLRNYQTILKDEQKLVIPNEPTTCNHEFVDVSQREIKDNNTIGRFACEYCTHCHRYFVDGQEISAKLVYVSLRSKKTFYGLKTTIVGCSMIFVSLAMFTVFAITNAKSKKRKDVEDGKQQ